MAFSNVAESAGVDYLLGCKSKEAATLNAQQPRLAV